MDGVQGTAHPPPTAFACFFSCEQVKSSVNLSRLAKLKTCLYSLNFPQSSYRRRLRSRITHSPWFPWVLTASVVPLDFHDLGSLVVLTNVPFGVALVFFFMLSQRVWVWWGGRKGGPLSTYQVRITCYRHNLGPMVLTLFTWLRQCVPGFSNIWVLWPIFHILIFAMSHWAQVSKRVKISRFSEVIRSK